MIKLICLLLVITTFSALGSETDQQENSSEMIRYTNQMLEEKRLEIEDRKEAFYRKYKSKGQDQDEGIED